MAIVFRPSESQRKFKKAKRDLYIDLIRQLKKLQNMKRDTHNRFNWCDWNDSQRICKKFGRLGTQKTSRDHPNYSLAVVGQNTGKSTRDLKRLVVTGTLVED